MKKELLLIASALIILTAIGCYHDSKSKSATDNNSFNLELLFTTPEGCKVYRFFDGLSAHYFTTCQGSTSSIIKEGKSERQEEIQTTYIPSRVRTSDIHFKYGYEADWLSPTLLFAQ